MRIAEGLILRADSQKRIQQLKQRLLRVARVQEGDVAAEDPQKLLEQLEELCGETTRLIQRINATNVATRLDNGVTLTDALAERDMLKLRHDIYRELAEAATVTQDRYSKSEVKFRSTVPVAQLQQTADDLARRFREVDTMVQEMNWRTELAE